MDIEKIKLESLKDELKLLFKDYYTLDLNIKDYDLKTKNANIEEKKRMALQLYNLDNKITNILNTKDFDKILPMEEIITAHLEFQQWTNERNRTTADMNDINKLLDIQLKLYIKLFLSTKNGDDMNEIALIKSTLTEVYKNVALWVARLKTSTPKKEVTKMKI